MLLTNAARLAFFREPYRALNEAAESGRRFACETAKQRKDDANGSIMGYS
jgi:hypothetical protein